VVREALTSQALDALEPREAAALFIARRAEGLTSSEQQLLADWLAKDEAHKRVFDSADRAWQAFAGAEGDEILTAMRKHARAPRPQGLAQWRPVAAAAVLLLAVTAALALIPNLNPWSPAAQTIQYASVRGELKELSLPDGSSMTLDADSAATGRFGGKERTIELQRGRAYFSVKPDHSRPFAVTAANRRVVAVGTRFDVNLLEDGLTVTLLEGSVQVGFLDSGQAPVTLMPGQQYVERAGRAEIRTVGVAGENAVAWRSGLIRFDDQPLAEAAAIMNRYSTDQIVISGADVGSIRISGQFRAGEAERFAQTLAEIHKLRSLRQGDRIELSRQN
jgi:transmembrane sensor